MIHAKNVAAFLKMGNLTISFNFNLEPLFISIQCVPAVLLRKMDYKYIINQLLYKLPYELCDLIVDYWHDDYYLLARDSKWNKISCYKLNNTTTPSLTEEWRVESDVNIYRYMFTLGNMYFLCYGSVMEYGMWPDKKTTKYYLLNDFQNTYFPSNIKTIYCKTYALLTMRKQTTRDLVVLKISIENNVVTVVPFENEGRKYPIGINEDGSKIIWASEIHPYIYCNDYHFLTHADILDVQFSGENQVVVRIHFGVFFCDVTTSCGTKPKAFKNKTHIVYIGNNKSLCYDENIIYVENKQISIGGPIESVVALDQNRVLVNNNRILSLKNYPSTFVISSIEKFTPDQCVLVYKKN